MAWMSSSPPPMSPLEDEEITDDDILDESGFDVTGLSDKLHSIPKEAIHVAPKEIRIPRAEDPAYDLDDDGTDDDILNEIDEALEVPVEEHNINCPVSIEASDEEFTNDTVENSTPEGFKAQTVLTENSDKEVSNKAVENSAEEKASTQTEYPVQESANLEVTIKGVDSVETPPAMLSETSEQDVTTELDTKCVSTNGHSEYKEKPVEEIVETKKALEVDQSDDELETQSKLEEIIGDGIEVEEDKSQDVPNESEEGSSVHELSPSEDFAAFNAFPSENSVKDESGWAQFASAPEEAQLQDDFDDDEFGDFEDPSVQVEENRSRTGDIVISLQSKCQSVIEEVVDIDPSDASPVESNCAILDPTDDSIWQLIKEVESTPALGYGWSKSTANETLMKKLNIDVKNILLDAGFRRGMAPMPAFAGGLSSRLLEPTKVEEQSPSLSKKGTSDPEMGQEKQEATIPPVEFDWKDSGLTNPLATEGLERGVEAEATKSPTNILDQLMQGKPADSPKPKKTLSKEAAQIIKSFPLLNFMQSSVLMYPTVKED